MSWFTRRARPTTRRRAPLHVEALEDRTVPTVSAISATALGPAVAPGSTLWFSAALKVSGLGAAPVTIHLSEASVNGPGFTAAAPSAVVTFSPTATTASTTYDAGSHTWITTVPSGLGGNAFLDGLALPAPAGLTGANPATVTWQGDFTTDTPGVGVAWQWSATDYTQSVPADPNALGVKPVDGSRGSQYQNNDRAGTLEALKPGGLMGLLGGLLGVGTPPTVASSSSGTVSPSLYAPPSASLAGLVYSDSDGNGQYTPGEVGVQSVTVTLTGTDDLGQSVSVSTTTDPSGNYQFTGLRPGNYSLTATTPPLLTPGGATAGTVGGNPDGVATSGTEIDQIALGAGQSGIGYDFGEVSRAHY
jgi:hypothetical protein